MNHLASGTPLTAAVGLGQPGKRGSFLWVMRRVTFWAQWLVGALGTIILLAVLAADKSGTGQVDSLYRIAAVAYALVSLPIYAVLQVYDKRLGLAAGALRVAVAWAVTLCALLLLGFITKTSVSYSREVMLLWAATGGLAQLGLFVPLHLHARRYHHRQQAQRVTAIVGTGPLARQVARHSRDPVIGFIEFPHEPDASLHGPVLGPLSQLRPLIEQHGIRRLYLALPHSAVQHISALYVDLLDAQVDVIWVPDLSDLLLLNHSVHHVGPLAAVSLNESPLTTFPEAAFTKAVIDRVVALCAVVALAPVLAALAIGVRLSSPGPVLFRQQRHGLDGQIIEVWKFRSMRLHHDGPVVRQATQNDPRVTPFGAFLRRTSLDELPQFFNVLQGHLSLVGPRPHAVSHNHHYQHKISAYMSRHRVKPGITGLAQISGFRGETDTLDKMQQRVELDLAYINNWSIALDVKILLKTPLAMASKNAY